LSSQTSNETGPGQPCVLVASQDPDLCSRFRETLLRDGYNARVATSSREALDLLVELAPDVVIVDADVADDGARRFLDTAGASFPRTAIIIAAAEGDQDAVLERTAFAAFDYMPRTCSGRVLSFRVARAFERLAEGEPGEDGRGEGDEGDVQGHLRELSALYNICQEVGKEVPLARTLRSITRLLVEGMRLSSVVIAEIWLDGMRHSEFPELPERGNEISAPVCIGKNERGKLVVYACRNIRFTPGEVALVTNTAKKVGYMVRRSELRRALYESENKHRRLVEAISEGVFWAEIPAPGVKWEEDTDNEAALATCLHGMRVTDCNLRFASFYGFSSVQECIGTPLREFFPSASHARSYLRAICTKGRVFRVLDHTEDTGRTVRVGMLSRLIRRGRSIVGIQGVNIDQAHLEAGRPSHPGKDAASADEFAQRDGTFEKAIGECECCVVLADLDGTITYANPAQARLAGREVAELVGASVSVFSVPGQEQLESDMESGTLKDGAWSGRLLRRRADGELIPVHMKTSLIRDGRGRPIAQLRSAHDLSEQERLRTQLEAQSENLRRIVEQRTRKLVQSERNYRFLYENAPIGTIITTLTGMIVEANPAICDLLGYPREDLLKKNLAFLFRLPERYQEMMARLSAESRVMDEEIEYRARDGERLTMQQSSVLMGSEDAEMLILHFLRDVTQAKKLAREAEVTRQQIARADRLASLGQLVAGVAHELNNPLTAVLTYAHLLRKKMGGDEEPNRQIDLIAEAGTRCRQIVRDLLDFARERSPNKGLADLNEIIEHVLDMMHNQMLIQKVSVRKQLRAGLPAVRVDRHQIEQVFVNICMNGLEAMSEGGTLSVTTDYDPENMLVTAAFEDTGAGIPEANVEKIFDPFFTTKAPGAGTGLGLAVSQRIVTNHGGHVHVASEIGKGSTFTVELPVGTREGEAVAEEQP